METFFGLFWLFCCGGSARVWIIIVKEIIM